MVFLCPISCYLTTNSAVYYFVHEEIQSLRNSRSTTDELDPEAPEETEEGVPLLIRS